MIEEHSNIGLVITCDGSFGEIPRNNYIESEEKTVAELKKAGKPFLILVNSQKPYKEETLALCEELKQKYQAGVLSVNCEQLRRDDVTRIMERCYMSSLLCRWNFLFRNGWKSFPQTIT